MKNTYGKALRHLKNRNIDEKLKLVEAIPTNNTTGVMMDVPGEFVTVPGEVPREADLGTDGDGVEGYTGADTSGLFLEDGTILIEEPIGDKSYVLGPMISMWYSWANYTQIGYVRQSDRKMVNLGRITGQLEDWDGENGFTSYGQMTIEQAVWYKQQSRSDYRAFYPGPPSNPADEFGRYIGSMVNTTKSTTTVVKQQDTTKPFDASDNFAAQVARGEVPIPQIPRGNAQYDAASELVMIGISAALAKALMGGLAALGARAQREVAEFVKLWKSTGRGPGPLPKSTTPRTTKARYKSDPMDKVLRDIDKANKASPPKGSSFTRGDNIRGPYSADKAVSRPGSGKYKSSSRNYDPKNNPSFGSRRGTRKFNNSYDPQGNYIAEGITDLPVELIAIVNSILAEIGNKPESIDKLISILEKSPKKKTSVKESKEFLSENRKRILRDLRKPVHVEEIGPPTKFRFKPSGRNNKSVGVDMMKIPDTPAQYKPPMNIWGKGDYNANVRSSQEKKNEVLELVGASEHHWTYLTDESSRKKQDKINEMQSAEYDKELEMLYEKHKIKENKTDKVIKYLKDSKDKLDLQSAESMPPTGNPTIDDRIRKSTNTKGKSKKLKTLLGDKKKINEAMTTGALMSTTLPAEGDVDLVNVDLSNADTFYYSGTGGTTVSDSGLSFDQRPSNIYSSNWTLYNLTTAIDATAVNNLTVSVTAGTGVDTPKSGNDLTVEWVSDTDYGVLGTFSAAGGTQVFELPKEANVKNLSLFYSVSGNGTNYRTYTDGYLVGQSIFGGDMNFDMSQQGMSILNSGSTPNPFPPNYPTSEDVKALYGFTFWIDALTESRLTALRNGSISGPMPPSWGGVVPPGQVSGGFTRQDQIDIYNQIHNLYSSYNTRASNLYTITTTNFQRRTPMNVFVSLDSPEATAFIRTDPIMQGLSAEDRRKKLMEMLDAGDKYLLQQLGMTGSKARPSEVIMPPSWEQAATYGGKEAEDRKRIRDMLNNPNDPFYQKPTGQGQPGRGRGMGDRWLPSASTGTNTQVAAAGVPRNTGGKSSGDPNNIQWPRDKYKDKKAPPGPGARVDFAHYEPQGETIMEKKKKSFKDLTSQIPGYYDGKPAPLGFPMEEPPETKNGYHPDLVTPEGQKKQSNRYNNLDPQSAKAMPPTGNPYIDKKVRAAAKKSK